MIFCEHLMAIKRQKTRMLIIGDEFTKIVSTNLKYSDITCRQNYANSLKILLFIKNVLVPSFNLGSLHGICKLENRSGAYKKIQIFAYIRLTVLKMVQDIVNNQSKSEEFYENYYKKNAVFTLLIMK